MALQIRTAQVSDLKSIEALYRQLQPDDETTFDEIATSFSRMQAYPGCEVYVAEEDHQICGTFVIYFLPNMTRNGRMAAVLENIVVDAEYRSKGIGRSMLEFARQKAVEQNCYKLSLTSNLKRTNAHAFYEHCGMQRHGYSFRYIL